MNHAFNTLQAKPTPLSGSGMVLVLHSHTEAWQGPRFERDLQRLPQDEQARILRFKRSADQRASLVGRLLLAQGLEFFGYPWDALHHLRYTTYGKPFLADLNLDFNISHCGDYVVCAVSQDNRLGIDLERLRRVPLSDLAASLDAVQQLDVAAAADPDHRLLSYWTKKEAVAKCRGEGLNLPLDQMSGLDDELSLQGESWRCAPLEISPGYVCHAVAKSPPSGWKVLRGLC